MSSYPLCLVRNRHECRISHTLHSYPTTHYSLIPAGQTPSHSTAHPLHLSHGSHSLCCHHTYATLPTPGPSARNRCCTVASHRSAYHSAGDRGLTRTRARSRRISAHVAAYTSLPGCLRSEVSTPCCRCALSVMPTFSAPACRPHKKCLKPCGLRLASMPRCLKPLLHYRLRHVPLCAPSLPRRAILPPTMGLKGVPSVSQVATRSALAHTLAALPSIKNFWRLTFAPSAVAPPCTPAYSDKSREGRWSSLRRAGGGSSDGKRGKIPLSTPLTT